MACFYVALQDRTVNSLMRFIRDDDTIGAEIKVTPRSSHFQLNSDVRPGDQIIVGSNRRFDWVTIHMFFFFSGFDEGGNLYVRRVTPLWGPNEFYSAGLSTFVSARINSHDDYVAAYEHSVQNQWARLADDALYQVRRSTPELRAHPSGVFVWKYFDEIRNEYLLVPLHNRLSRPNPYAYSSFESGKIYDSVSYCRGNMTLLWPEARHGSILRHSVGGYTCDYIRIPNNNQQPEGN